MRHAAVSCPGCAAVDRARLRAGATDRGAMHRWTYAATSARATSPRSSVDSGRPCRTGQRRRTGPDCGWRLRTPRQCRRTPDLACCGGPGGRGATLNNIGLVHGSRGELDQALDYYEELSSGDPGCGGGQAGETSTLTRIGDLHKKLIELDLALNYPKQALPIHRGVGSRAWQASTLCGSACCTSRGELAAGSFDACRRDTFHQVFLTEEKDKKYRDKGDDGHGKQLPP